MARKKSAGTTQAPDPPNAPARTAGARRRVLKVTGTPAPAEAAGTRAKRLRRARAEPAPGYDAAPRRASGPRALIIAEKPSVAREIAKALGGFRFTGGHAESDRFVLAWAIGHLLEFEPPDAIRPELARRWSCEHLPVIPEEFRLVPRTERGRGRTRRRRRGAASATSATGGAATAGAAGGGGGAQLKLLGRLLRDPSVTSLVNACDAGREGERIFRTITEHFGVVKPMRRLWVNAMTREALRSAFDRLLPGESKDDLARAAACRAEADWLIGMNGTMAFTARLQGRSARSRGAASVYSLGRVQTPTLALVVDRELEIRAFRAVPYWEVETDFRQDEAAYLGRWFDPNAEEGKDPYRIGSREAADAIAARIEGREGTASDESKRVTLRPPLLFDLTSLQAEANRRFRLPAKATLAALEKLYLAGHISYPRTGCRYLASADTGTVSNIVEALRGGAAYASLAAGIDRRRLSPANRRLFNDAEVKKEDHTAIVPTAQPPAHVPEGIGGRLYDLVVRAFLAALYPDAVSDEVTRTTVVGEDRFRSRGRILRVAGWRAVYGATADEAGAALPEIDTARPVAVAETRVLDLETKSPARFSEATLLKAMETAGRVIDDEELREAMKERGLGTPATRAETLEKLFEKGYMERMSGGKEIAATGKGVEFVEVLRRLELPELTRAELTGDWEHKLRLMERGEYARERFMTEIRGLAERVVARACGASFEEIFPAVHDLPGCPRCGDRLTATPRTYACARTREPECPVEIPRVIAGRPLDAEEIRTLLTSGRTSPLDGFRSARGRLFTAALALRPEGGVDLIWDGKERDEPSTTPVSEEPVGACRVCSGDVLAYENAYRCGACGFSFPRTLLGVSIPAEEMKRLLAGEKTELLTMTSRKTGRPFQAWLTLSKKGKLAFEFPPREGGASGARTFRRRRTTRRRAKAPAR